MTVFVFVAVLFAALLHASWNAIIKFGDDKFQGMVLLSVGHALISLVLIAISPYPAKEVWPWLGASALFHFGYKAFLAAAYTRGDLSRVYPIARGSAPMMVLVVGYFALQDNVTGLQMLGIVTMGLGIFLMARGVFIHGESLQLLPFALLSAVGTAGYSLLDGIGARVAGDATMFTAWMSLIDSVLFLVWGFNRRGLAVLPASAQLWGLGLLAGAVSFGAYWIVVWSMTVAPIALVTALRESSVMFAVLIGVLFFKERADIGKLIAAGVIVSGIILIRI